MIECIQKRTIWLGGGRIMRKQKRILWLLITIIVISGCTKKNEVAMLDVLSTSSTRSDNWYEESIYVVADKSMLSDKEACAKEIIQRVLDNSFHSVCFSFSEIEDGVEVSRYPNELHVSVYSSKEDFKQGEHIFAFEYVTEFNEDDLYNQNNIKDHPEAFRIIYRDI